MYKEIKKITICILLFAVFCISVCRPMPSVYAVEKSLSLSQAKKIALAGSDSYRKLKSKIILKEFSYEQALKSAHLREKNEATFRWSPLVTLRLPQNMNFEEESSLVCEPLQLQMELRQLEFSLKNEVYKVHEETAQSFLKVYTYQEKVSIWENRLEELRKSLKKNQGRVILGLATKSDLGKIENELIDAEETLAQNKKNFINEKLKLGELLHLDISTGYIFADPYVEERISREALEDFVQYALENESSYYEAKLASQLALLQLTENYSLLEKQYGFEMEILNVYIQQVKSGQEVDLIAFKESYDLFLKKMEESWQGEQKIYSLSIEKEWMMGETSGIRYLEDQPYALYENVLEYQVLVQEEEAKAKELKQQIRDKFETLITLSNRYKKLKKETEEYEKRLQKEQLMNSMGQLSYEDYMASKTQYEMCRLEQLEALEEYSSVVYSLDKITCGAVGEFVEQKEPAFTENNKYMVNAKEIEGAKYYIQSLVEDNMFEFGIYLPKNLETEISHYELIVDDVVVGKKTEVKNTLRHLTLSLSGEERIFVRLYQGSEVVDDCIIDPMAYQGELKIKEFVVEKTDQDAVEKRRIGDYEISIKKETGLMELIPGIKKEEGICYYSLQNKEGKSLISEDKKYLVSEGFIYLNLSKEELENMKILCFDENKTLKYTAFFDTKKYEIYVIEKQ